MADPKHVLDALIADGKNYDGDTVYGKPRGEPDRKGYRLTGFDTPEVTKNHPNAQLAKDTLSALVADGGARTSPTGEHDKYGRELTDLVDENGNNLSTELIAGGLAVPTGFSSAHEQDGEMYGNIRQAFTGKRSTNDVINEYSAKRTDIDEMIKYIGRRQFEQDKGYYDTRGTLSRSWDRGVEDSKMAMGGAINYLGDRLGSDIISNYGREMFEEAVGDNQWNAREYESYKEVEDVGDLLTYGLESIGEALPSVLMDGGIALASGGTALPGIIAKRAAGKGVAKALSGRMATGAALSSGIQGVGSMEAELEQAGSSDNAYAPLASGLVAGLATKLPVGAVLNRVLGGLDDKTAKTVGERIVSSFKTAAVGGAVEAPASAIESMSNQIIKQIALKQENDGLEWEQVIDDTIRGVIGGGAFAGGGQAFAEGVGVAYDRAKKNAGGWQTDEDGKPIEKEIEVPSKNKIGIDPTDIPNLKSKDYEYVQSILEPNGRPVSRETLKRMVEDGKVTGEQVAQYLADDIGGEANDIVELQGTDRIDSINSQKLTDIIKGIRDGDLKLEPEVVRLVSAASKSKSGKDMQAAVDAVGSAFDSKGKKYTALNYRFMWKSYLERVKPTSAPTEAPDLNKVADELLDDDIPDDYGDVPPYVEAQQAPPTQAPDPEPEDISKMGYMDFARLKADQGDATFKEALEYFDVLKDSDNPEDVKNLTAVVRIINQRAKEGIQLIQDGEDTSPLAEAQQEFMDEDGDDSDPSSEAQKGFWNEDGEKVGGDIGSEVDPFEDLQGNELNDERLGEKALKTNREGFARQFRDLTDQLQALPELAEVSDELEAMFEGTASELLQTDNDGVRSLVGERTKDRELSPEFGSLTGDSDTAPVVKGGKVGAHPRRLTTKADDAVQNEGTRPARVLNENSLNAIKGNLKRGRPDKAIEHLKELGLFTEGHLVGDTPKRSLETDLKQKARATNRRVKDGSLGKTRTVKTTNGDHFDTADIVQLGLNTDQLALRSDSQSTIDGVETGKGVNQDKRAQGIDGFDNTNTAIAQAFYSGISALIEAGHNINLRDLPNSTVVFERPILDKDGKPAKGKDGKPLVGNLERVTLGQLKQSLHRSANYKGDNSDAFYWDKRGETSNPVYGDAIDDGYGSGKGDWLDHEDVRLLEAEDATAKDAYTDSERVRVEGVNPIGAGSDVNSAIERQSANEAATKQKSSKEPDRPNHESTIQLGREIVSEVKAKYPKGTKIADMDGKDVKVLAKAFTMVRKAKAAVMHERSVAQSTAKAKAKSNKFRKEKAQEAKEANAKIEREYEEAVALDKDVDSLFTEDEIRMAEFNRQKRVEEEANSRGASTPRSKVSSHKTSEGASEKRRKLLKGKRIRDNRAIKRTTHRLRKKAPKAIFRFLEMINTRLDRIHPDIALLAKKFTLNRQVKAEHFTSALSHIGDAKAIQKGYEDAMAGKQTTEAKKYREWVNAVDAEVRKYDPTHKGKNGLVISLNLSNIDQNREGFLAIVKKAGVKNPLEFVEAVFDGNGQPQWAIDPTASNSTRNRVDELESVAKELKEAGFLDEDAPRMLKHYAHAAANWAMWNKYMGENGDPSGLYNHYVKEVHPANLGELNKLMAGITGKNTLGHSPYLHKFNSAALGFQTATILWFSAVASIPEMAGVVSRNKGLVDGLGSDAYKLLSATGRDDLRAFAKDMGVISAEVIEHALQQLYGMDAMTTGRVTQKISDVVFTANGQNYLTELNRALAASTAKRFLEHHANNDSPRSKRLLAELEIDAETVKAYLRNPKVKSPNGRLYRDAIHRFVNEAVTNPHTSQLPLIATDPRFAIFTSLKKFFYGFYDNIHKASYREFKAAGTEGTRPEVYKAMMLTGAMMIPMAALSELIREFIKYPFGNPKGDRDLGTFVGHTMMATGGLGPLSMAQLPYEMMDYGRNPAVTALGPTAGYVEDVLRGRVTFERHVPIASQIPWAREAVKTTRKKLTE